MITISQGCKFQEAGLWFRVACKPIIRVLKKDPGGILLSLHCKLLYKGIMEWELGLHARFVESVFRIIAATAQAMTLKFTKALHW